MEPREPRCVVGNRTQRIRESVSTPAALCDVTPERLWCVQNRFCHVPRHENASTVQWRPQRSSLRTVGLIISHVLSLSASAVYVDRMPIDWFDTILPSTVPSLYSRMIVDPGTRNITCRSRFRVYYRRPINNAGSAWHRVVLTVIVMGVQLIQVATSCEVL